jgi:hypothetical protein
MNVMTRAWEIARKGAAKFGEKVKEYFAQALRLAWAEVKEKKTASPLQVATVQAQEEAKKVFSKCLDMFIAKKFIVANRSAETATVTDPAGNTRKVVYDLSGARQVGNEFTYTLRVLALQSGKVFKVASKTLKFNIA